MFVDINVLDKVKPALRNMKEIAQECNSREEPGQWTM